MKGNDMSLTQTIPGSAQIDASTKVRLLPRPLHKTNAMQLIDRYLQAVKWMLPRKQQDDVVRELNDEILSRVEEKEDALALLLTEDGSRCSSRWAIMS